MAIGISLVNFTDQGIRNIKDSPKRAAAFRELAKKQGVAVRDVRLGNVRTQTLRGMDQETFQRVLAKVD